MLALPIFMARASYRHAVVSVRWTLTGICCQPIIYRKKLQLKSWSFVFALPIFTASHPATIVGVHVLNFCVRNGNRWTHMTINTNLCGWLLTIFICQMASSHLTCVFGAPSGTRTRDPLIKSQLLYQLS